MTQRPTPLRAPLKARLTAPLAMLLAALALASSDRADASAPVDTCSGAFCTTLDLGTFDALAPTQPTTAAAQPTNLALRFTDTSAGVGTDKSTWLAKVSAALGPSSSKAMAVTDPAQLPLGAYLAGSAATAGTCAPGLDGSGYATTCPAGHGTGQIELRPILGSPSIMPLTFGVQNVTTGAGGALSASVSIWIPSVTTVLPITVSAPLTYGAATSTSGPSLTMDVRQTVTPVGPYLPSDLSLNDLSLTVNGLVTDAAAGAVTPPVAFVRQSLVCTSVTTTLAASARGPQTVAVPVTEAVTGCPVPPTLVSVVPVAGQPRAFTFSMTPPTAAVPGRTASLEWVFGDGSKATTGASATHTYPVVAPVTALVSAVDSAGARSPAVAVQIAASALRAKQQAGDLITGELADQATDAGLGGQQVLGFHCATRHTPIVQCDEIGSTTTRSSGTYRLHLPEVAKKGFVVVSYAGRGTTSAGERARFPASRVVDVLPQPDVTLHLSRTHVRPGATVRLSGKVEPGKVGKTVRLQGLVRGKWRSLGKATVSRHGTYATTYVVQVRGPDKVKVRALVPGTAATLAATSKVRVIRILR